MREIFLSQVLEQTSIAESQREQETFPACAYAALEFCERHLGALRNQLKQVRAQNMSGISNISDGIVQMHHGFHTEGNDERKQLQQHRALFSSTGLMSGKLHTAPKLPSLGLCRCLDSARGLRRRLFRQRAEAEAWRLPTALCRRGSAAGWAPCTAPASPASSAAPATPSAGATSTTWQTSSCPTPSMWSGLRCACLSITHLAHAGGE